MDNWNSANTVLHYGKNGALTGPDKERAETSMLALHLFQCAPGHVNTLLVQQVSRRIEPRLVALFCALSLRWEGRDNSE